MPRIPVLSGLKDALSTDPFPGPRRRARCVTEEDMRTAYASTFPGEPLPRASLVALSGLTPSLVFPGMLYRRSPEGDLVFKSVVEGCAIAREVVPDPAR